MSDLEKRFDAAMMGVYRRANAEAHYNPSHYHKMLMQHGGLETGACFFTPMLCQTATRPFGSAAVLTLRCSVEIL